MTAQFAISVPIGAWHPLLDECLQSLVAQGGRAEIAALDASGDSRVAALLDKYENYLTYRRTGPDGGQSDAIVTGWRNMSASILGWLNADDALYPHALEVVAERFAAEPALDLVYGDSTIIDDKGAYRGFHWAVRPPGDEILAGCTISQPSCFFRREAVDKIGGLNCDLHYTMDWDLWVRLWRAGAKFGFIDEILSRVLWSENAKTGGFNVKRRAELERIIAAHSDLTSKTKSRIGFALHHLLEYRAPSFLARTIRRRKARASRIINGLDRAGGVHGLAYLPIVCWSKPPSAVLEVDLSPGSAGRLCVGEERVSYHDGRARLRLDAPPVIGEITELVLEPTRQTFLRGAWWA